MFAAMQGSAFYDQVELEFSTLANTSTLFSV